MLDVLILWGIYTLIGYFIYVLTTLLWDEQPNEGAMSVCICLWPGVAIGLIIMFTCIGIDRLCTALVNFPETLSKWSKKHGR